MTDHAKTANLWNRRPIVTAPPLIATRRPFSLILARAAIPAALLLAASAHPAKADFRLCNNTGSRVGVSIGYKDNEGWTTEGWWNVSSRSCETLLRGALVARYYYIYAVDYDRGGEWSGKAYMASDHLGPETRRSPSTPILFGALAPTPDLGLGFGLGFAVRTHSGRNPLPGSIGDFFWSGVSGTYFWIDPKQQLIAILMMQAPMQRLHYRYLMRTMVYQAIVG